MKDRNGKTLKCPKCNSENIDYVKSDIGLAFDYLKVCLDCKHEFSAVGNN